MRLDNATPAQLVRALTNDNMFWRLTAQRLLVERGKTDVVPALLTLANDHTVDALGLNPGALHALWTLHGLGALTSNADAMTAARNAMYHPAASVRRAALMMLPRDQRLVDDIFKAGMLPDRTSPWTVEYTVATPILQDADAHVRLEALLVLADMPGAPRAAAAISDIIMYPGNARDPWLPDAVAMVAVKQGPEFLQTLLQRRTQGADSLTLAGMRRAVTLIARFHAATANAQTVVAMITAVPQANPAVGVGVLEGIATGWPLETPPQLSAEQRSALVAAARGSNPDLTAVYDRIATRWTMPDVFKTP
jgi:hypothetical protein